MENILPAIIQQAPFAKLKEFTNARIGVERYGVGIATKEILKFRADYALAKDALLEAFDIERLHNELVGLGCSIEVVQSLAVDKLTYLQRPDLGRTLLASDMERLRALECSADICFIVSDGLSARAANTHASQILKGIIPKLQQQGFSIAPIVLLQGGRVATSDYIGEALQSKVVCILLGERPGLSSPDSLGAYLTYQPQIGLTDDSRNCISNIRPEGLAYFLAIDKIMFLIQEAIRLKLSGVDLKEESNLLK